MFHLTHQLYDSSSPYNGVLNYIKLFTKHEDIHSSGDIQIIVSSNNTESPKDIRLPIGVDNAERDKWWYSDNIENSWYIY